MTDSERDPTGTFRTESGLIFRVTRSPEGSLRVDVLRGGGWEPGRIGMVGLRLQSTTRRLKASAIRALPA